MATLQKASRKPRTRGISKILRTIVLYILLFAVIVFWIIPIVWMLLTSIKTNAEIFHFPIVWLPAHATLQSYQELFTSYPVFSWFQNSIIVAIATTILTVIVDALAAYPLARMRFHGRRVIMIIILATFLLPTEILLVPQFIGLSHLGISDSYLSLVLPLVANAFGVFLLVQFFQSIPTELEEAALIDGSTRAGFFWRILLPLTKPALVSVAIFAFMGSWNNFFWPLIVTNSDTTRTLPVGLSVLVAGSGMAMQYGTLMAAAAVATIPALLVFIALQRYFVKGIATVGLKG